MGMYILVLDRHAPCFSLLDISSNFISFCICNAYPEVNVSHKTLAYQQNCFGQETARYLNGKFPLHFRKFLEEEAFFDQILTVTCINPSKVLFLPNRFYPYPRMICLETFACKIKCSACVPDFRNLIQMLPARECFHIGGMWLLCLTSTTSYSFKFGPSGMSLPRYSQ